MVYTCIQRLVMHAEWIKTPIRFVEETCVQKPNICDKYMSLLYVRRIGQLLPLAFLIQNFESSHTLPVLFIQPYDTYENNLAEIVQA